MIRSIIRDYWIEERLINTAMCLVYFRGKIHLTLAEVQQHEGHLKRQFVCRSLHHFPLTNTSWNEVQPDGSYV